VFLDPLRHLGLVRGRVHAGKAQARGRDPGGAPAPAAGRGGGGGQRASHLGQRALDRGGDGQESFLEADVVKVAAGAQAAGEDGPGGVGDQGLGVRAAAVDGEEELGRAHAAPGRGRRAMPALLSAE
jgi:hypothetical protein